MTTIQAYRRSKLYTHVFPDVTLIFEPNELGDVVCDVESQSAVDRLLLTPTGFREYVKQEEVAPVQVIDLAAKVEPFNVVTEPVKVEPFNVAEPVAEAVKEVAEAPTAPAAPSKYLLIDGDVSIDLMLLDEKALREFAAANQIKIPNRAGEMTLRDKIAAALNTPE